MNSRQLILTTVTAILMALSHSALSHSVAAEDENESRQENNGYPDYQIKASYDLTESRGKYQDPNTSIQSNQGDNGKNGKKGKRHSDKNHFNEESAWYKPWSWYNNNPDKDDDNNQNSNRQSDPDSTRGQARAEERRDNKDHLEIEHPWYDPRGWFGQ